MTFATWWRRDSLPNLSPLPTFSTRLSTDIEEIARLTNHSPQVIATRLQAGNRPCLAFMGDIPVAYGWVATQEGSIAELQLSFPILSGNCYLYSFLTLPEWRGRGIYPHLLQAIIRQEEHIQRFWIGYLPDNAASGRGIEKAGFHVVSDLVVSQGQVSGITLFESSEQAQASADFFCLPVVTEMPQGDLKN
jgi:RimJ/RimL family protein N-acetyltransferase